ncbi:small ribosomal subunit protein uS9m [Danio rerio]|uniref:Small ribosomal subunit protein uS9m n=1 Tax=Danio rerio TaxID=7955 RepID=Q0P4B8_DANRE|nr:28S ribosomal protein S9, mitochondrial [Danio rerio]AAI22172.1 Zgc:153172 [Danio rerio]|eukprot:NP_001038861.1 28S ribosomal protein S9, mitochondrial [Danio rerio]
MAASGSRCVRLILWKYGSCGKNFCLSRSRTASQLPVRQICVSSSLWKKNLAAAGPQKFTQEFIDKQVEEFEIGKRHLANMMGEDPETFTQEDVDRSIAYLFPSGLFEKHARPVMKHPEQIFPKQKAVQWDAEGRPFHFLFYTGKQSYYSLMHDVYDKMLVVEKHQDKMRNKGLFMADTKQISLSGSRWLLKEEMEEILVENISDQDYLRFIQLAERLLSMPYCSLEENFILKFRKPLEVQSREQEIPELQHDARGVAFSVADGRRKSAKARVTLIDSGSGNITINGTNYLHYFPVLQDREQLMFPLHFVGLLGRFDIEGSVEGSGRSSQAGAVRLAISRALLSFVSEGEVEKMRQAGLLTADPRIKERKKPGQEKARKKFTWKKR